MEGMSSDVQDNGSQGNEWNAKSFATQNES